MKSSTYFNCYSIVGVFIVFSIFVQGQTIINEGPVSGIWTTIGSPYHVMGDIEIPAGSTLIIEAGVLLKFILNYQSKFMENF